MNAEIKSKWIEALKSNRYTQGIDRLRNDMGEEPDTYCCLGVLCDIHAKETGEGSWEDRKYCQEQDRGYRTAEDGAFYVTSLPVPVYKWAGIRSSDEDTVDELMGMNDSGVPFHEIADYIEASL